MNVYFNGSHIPNSPFKVRVCNPEAIWAEGPGLMDSCVGDQGDFQVFTKDAGHGTLSELSFVIRGLFYVCSCCIMREIHVKINWSHLKIESFYIWPILRLMPIHGHKF